MKLKGRVELLKIVSGSGLKRWMVAFNNANIIFHNLNNCLRHADVRIQTPIEFLTVPGLQIHPAMLQTLVHPVVCNLIQDAWHPSSPHDDKISFAAVLQDITARKQ